MSVEQIDKVDFISTTEKGIIKLTISDHLEWDAKNEHLLILQNKINAYLNFIESGQILEEYPSSANKKIEIEIVLQFPPNEIANIFLNKCKTIINEQNIEFKWRVLENKCF